MTQEAANYARTQKGAAVSGWVYPFCVGYPVNDILDMCRAAGLHVQKLQWFHPRQTWFRAVLDEGLLLTPEMEQTLGTGQPLFDSRFP